jgi:hypothetical protein
LQLQQAEGGTPLEDEATLSDTSEPTTPRPSPDESFVFSTPLLATSLPDKFGSPLDESFLFSTPLVSSNEPPSPCGVEDNKGGSPHPAGGPGSGAPRLPVARSGPESDFGLYIACFAGTNSINIFTCREILRIYSVNGANMENSGRRWERVLKGSSAWG